MLTAGLAVVLADDEERWLADARDLLVVLAPYHDCARRLGLDPQEFFNRVGAAGPDALRETVIAFGQRDDVTPEAFGFALVDEADGPRYRWL